AVGHWYMEQDAELRPTIILTSPYVRARQTAEEITNVLKRGATPVELVFDERLREREFGALDRLTKLGITERFPDEEKMRARVGKFYYRPPGGESWCDVILRLRSVLDSLARDYAGERVLIVCHSVVILCFRYIFEAMTEEQILKIDRESDIANCSLTTYIFEESEGTAGKPKLETFNFVAPLREANEPVTTAQDAPTANS
ncbi:MAG: histidine phosphatase family protein, partial [Proteobacteria bacterium]